MSRLRDPQFDAIVTLSRLILERSAPSELVIFDHSAPRIRDHSFELPSPGSRPMGFGGAGEVAVLFPILVNFLRDLATSTIQSLTKRFSARLGVEVEKLLDRGSIAQKDAATRDSIDAGSLIGIRESFEALVRSRGFSEKTVQAIANDLLQVVVERPELFRSLVQS